MKALGRGQAITILVLILIAISTPAATRISTSVELQSESEWVGGTIYIRADGSVYPSDAPISTYDYRTYLVVKNIRVVGIDGVVIERDNIVLDGNGHTVRGSRDGAGIRLSRRSNITIRNIAIADFHVGIVLDKSKEIAIVNNTIFNTSWNGISLFGSNSTIIVNNTVFNTIGSGVLLAGSNNNIVANNTIFRTGGDGVSVAGSYNNLVSSNTISGTREAGVCLYSSHGNTVKGNIIMRNHVGIWLILSQDNVFLYNDLTDNTVQVRLDEGVGYNAWDDGRVGNYWSTHPCADADGNGVCDKPYVIRDPDNIDRYPSVYLFKPSPTLPLLPTPTSTQSPTTPSPTLLLEPTPTTSPTASPSPTLTPSTPSPAQTVAVESTERDTQMITVLAIVIVVALIAVTVLVLVLAKRRSKH